MVLFVNSIKVEFGFFYARGLILFIIFKPQINLVSDTMQSVRIKDAQIKDVESFSKEEIKTILEQFKDRANKEPGNLGDVRDAADVFESELQSLPEDRILKIGIDAKYNCFGFSTTSKSQGIMYYSWLDASYDKEYEIGLMPSEVTTVSVREPQKEWLYRLMQMDNATFPHFWKLR